jgi:hypothetical protein
MVAQQMPEMPAPTMTTSKRSTVTDAPLADWLEGMGVLFLKGAWFMELSFLLGGTKDCRVWAVLGTKLMNF